MLEVTSVDRSAVIGRVNDDIRLKALVTHLPLLSCEVCVIVPVRNEAENIEATLLALTNQIDLTGKPLNKNRYEIIVLANNCSDNSAQIARGFARTKPNLILHVVEMTLKGDRAHIGWVRKLLMDEACRRFRAIGRNSGVIASTDGDTRVFPTWIAATLAEISNGADAVGGRIITDGRERNKLDRATRLYYLRHLRYGYLTSQLETCLDPYFESFPRHHHHYGASFAVTASMYTRSGGLPPLPSSEDVALYEALKLIDARFRHSPQVKVVTSARAIGRTKAGLSDRLLQLNTMAQRSQPVLVESARLVEVRFYLRRWLRYLWQNLPQKNLPLELSIVARKLDLSSELLEEAIWRSPTFGLLVERIGQYQQDNEGLANRWQKVTIQKANADLRTIIDRCCDPNSQPQASRISLDTLEQIEPIPLLPHPL